MTNLSVVRQALRSKLPGFLRRALEKNDPVEVSKKPAEESSLETDKPIWKLVTNELCVELENGKINELDILMAPDEIILTLTLPKARFRDYLLSIIVLVWKNPNETQVRVECIQYGGITLSRFHGSNFVL